MWVKFKVGVRARIAFFVCWRSNKLYLFQMIGFCGLLAENRARTEVLPLPITRARPIHLVCRYILGDLRAKPVYRIGSPPPIKYRLSAITLNSLFLEQARALLRSICLV